MKYTFLTTLTIIFSLPFLIISLNHGGLKGYEPGTIGLVNSIVFVIISLLVSLAFGYFLGARLDKRYYIFLPLYWGILILIYGILEYNILNFTLLIPIGFLIAPFYGFTQYSSFENIIFLGIPLYVSFSMLSYFLGSKFQKILNEHN